MDANTLVKGNMPGWVADMFKRIDAKDIDGAKKYVAHDCDSYFGHFHLPEGPDGFLNFLGVFDAQYSEYHHLIDEVWAGPELVEFGGRVQFKIDDGTWVETPFYNRFFIDIRDGEPKIVPILLKHRWLSRSATGRCDSRRERSNLWTSRTSKRPSSFRLVRAVATALPARHRRIQGSCK